MRLNKNIFLSIVIGLMTASFSSLAISQVNYPVRPIKIIVGYAPGGTTDIIARIIAERFTASMGQPVFVENIPGAGGNLGAAAVARAAPDGYTLQLGTMGNMTINPSVYKNMPIDTLKAFQPISNIATVGIYYWKHGSDYVRFAEQMIENNIRVNKEFYVCPVFNEAIKAGLKIKTFDVPKMWGLGTPEDLNYFLEKNL